MSFAEVGRCRSAGVDVAVSADGSSNSVAAAVVAAAAAAAGGGAAGAAAGAAESKGLSMGSSGCGPI